MVVDFPDRVCQFRNKIPVVAYKNQRAFIFFSASTSNSTLCMSRWLVGSSSIRKLALLVITFASATLAFSPPLSTLIFFLYIISAEKKTPQQRPEFELCLTAAAKFHFIKYVVVNVKGLELVLGVEALFHIVSPDPLSLEGLMPGDHTQQGRLSLSVRTDQRDLITAVYFSFGVFGNGDAAKLLVACLSVASTRPGCLSTWKLMRRLGLSISTCSTRSSLSSRFMALCAAAAFDALALNRSINRSCCLI